MLPQHKESHEVKPVTFLKLVHGILTCPQYTIFLMSVEGQIGVNRWMQLFFYFIFPVLDVLIIKIKNPCSSSYVNL